MNKRPKVHTTPFYISPENYSFIRHFRQISGLNETQAFDFLLFVARNEFMPVLLEMEQIKKENPKLNFAGLYAIIHERYGEECPDCDGPSYEIPNISDATN
jgi:hypothetical protein